MRRKGLKGKEQREERKRKRGERQNRVKRRDEKSRTGKCDVKGRGIERRRKEIDTEVMKRGATVERERSGEERKIVEIC